MRTDDPNVPFSIVAGILGAVLLFVVIVALQALFYHFEAAELSRKARPYEELDRLDTEQLERLASYGWVDEASGVVHIPVERAMELMVQERAAGTAQNP